MARQAHRQLDQERGDKARFRGDRGVDPVALRQDFGGRDTASSACNDRRNQHGGTAQQLSNLGNPRFGAEENKKRSKLQRKKSRFATSRPTYLISPCRPVALKVMSG
jgi:hypothetical protein